MFKFTNISLALLCFGSDSNRLRGGTTSDSERRNLFNILETFGLVQRIQLPTYQNGNLLDYIITRQSNDIASDFMASDKISDHMALHASLSCQILLYNISLEEINFCSISTPYKQ